MPAEGAACLWGIQVRGRPEIGAAPGANDDGRQRGGFGQAIEIGMRDGAPFALFAMYDRVDNPPRDAMAARTARRAPCQPPAAPS